MKLLHPTAELLPGYVAALQRGWSADNLRGAAAAQEDLQRIATDPAAFLARMHDIEAAGPPVTLPSGVQVARIPGFTRWMWTDEGFDGSINLRWPKDLGALPPHVLGHIGYAVVPWQQGRGHAKAALAELLDLAREQGLSHVLLTTDPDNIASQRVMLANGAVLMEPFNRGPNYGDTPALRYRIELV